ncbi:hypothetical protein PIROE2DRAFT_4440 [Piromyces sp. E2]|nr:hypothetical protein PIROE2DRAFT_4440 [Piromyces sp. E2]|eukprot:OUM68016.1 hypothetical protein PIROE2DRAFT_4440 [Piromyces sp. E2]
MNNTNNFTNSVNFTDYERQEDSKGLMIDGKQYNNFDESKPVSSNSSFFLNTGTVLGKVNFMLTFIGGTVNCISTAANSLSPIMKIPCSLVYYSATVGTSFMQLCYVFRAFRLIILYKLNIFKVTILNKNKFLSKSKDGTLIEPNIYYKSIFKLVNKKLAWILLTVMVSIVIVISVSIHVFINVKYGPVCGFTPVDISARINSEKHGEEFVKKYNITNFSGLEDNVSTYHFMRPMFRFSEYLVLMFVGICILITIIFIRTKIKDSKKFGIKFDCISTAIITIIVGSVYIILRWNMDVVNSGVNDDNNNNNGFRHFLKQFYLRTKQGIIFFVAVHVYVQLTSVVIPLIQCIYIERKNKVNKDKSVNELDHFYKILQQPELVEELKEIAIQEFSVENILFWENYCILRNLVEKVIWHHQDLDENLENNDMSSLQDFMYTENSMSSYYPSNDYYDPRYPLIPQLIPYYSSFYYTFIDTDGPAAVNIIAETITRINYEINTCPTVGIFDEALKEVVENMFFSIYPIYLNQNGKSVGEIFKGNR